MALSPHYGFASTLQGNPLTEDDELKKLKPVVDTATKVWGVCLASLSCRSRAGLAPERYANGNEEGNRGCGRFVESIEHFAVIEGKPARA